MSGEIDLATSDQFKGLLYDAVSEAQTVMVNLSGVTFMDSTGLYALLRGHQLAVERGTTFSLVKASHQVDRVLQLTRCREHLSESSQA